MRSYPAVMPRHPRPAPRDPEATHPSPDAAPAPGVPGAPGDAEAVARPSLAGIGVAGISRRRVAWLGLTVLAAWIVFAFAGQAADAARATARLDHERASNADVAARTEALRHELDLVTQERWVLQQARAYRLGSRAERPFALAPDAPALADDAPGSPARRVGADPAPRSPVEGWLEVLFGPTD
ncbi:MAG: hypothetical protein ABIG85_01100 [Chloroflexota bacterium]